MRDERTPRAGRIILPLMMLGLLFLVLRCQQMGKEQEEDIRKHRFSTVAKVISAERKRPYYHYHYCFGGQVYEGSASSSDAEEAGLDYDSIIGAYFRVELSTQHPEWSHLYFDSLVPREVGEAEKCSFRVKRP